MNGHRTTVVPHDHVHCHTARHAEDSDCGTRYEARCSCGWAQGASSRAAADAIAVGHRSYSPDAAIIVTSNIPQGKITDDQLRDLFARHCECRPLDLTRGESDHAAIHDCDTGILHDIQVALGWQARRDHLAQKIWQWHRAGKPEKDWTCVATSDDFDYHHKPGESYGQTGKPSNWHVESRCEADEYEPLSPENLYYDDAMKRIRAATLEHNRVAVIVQGLLDRSTCLHPHPPWRIWTPDGFTAGIELVYDVSRVLAPGEAPDFEEYRAQLNQGLRVGCHTIGQRDAWRAHMEDLYGDKWWKHDGRHGRGPERIHLVHAQKRDGSCEFRWTRERTKAKWVPHPTRYGYRQATYPEIGVKWLCPRERLTCVDAYTPGDFRLFYDDPRLRAEYLRWAPILLACEDWHHAQRQKQDAPPGPATDSVGADDVVVIDDDDDGEDL